MKGAEDYQGLRVTVMGLGHFGGGIGATRFLAAQGARVTVTDHRDTQDLKASLDQIRDCPLEALHCGEHPLEDFRQADLVVASPAVRPDHPLLETARHHGARVTTEIALFWEHCPAKIIGITGSAGKSTTSTMIHHLLMHSGRTAWLGGNLGGSLLSKLDEIHPDHWVVLELSSFQLAYLDQERRSPSISVVTNFSPNHLDWHRSIDEYRQAKQTILRWQTPADCAVLNGKDEDVAAWPTQGRRCIAPDSPPTALSAGTCLGESHPSLPEPFLRRFPGQHQMENAIQAVTAVCAAGVSSQRAVSHLASLPQLPHRLEFVDELHQRRFYDDSKATTPESTIIALNAFDHPIILLAGGADKGSDLTRLAAMIAQRCKAVSLMGETAGVLHEAIRQAKNSPHRTMTHQARDFQEAFDWALSQSHPGDVILLSPGCASFGWFQNYKERGEQFREMVRRFENHHPSP